MWHLCAVQCPQGDEAREGREGEGMKVRLFLGGLLAGAGVGPMVGGALVRVAADGSGTRKYPVVVSTLLAIAGVSLTAPVLRRPGR
jgi:hypothetical protein